METEQVTVNRETDPGTDLPHWWSFPAAATEPTSDQLVLREQFDSLLRSTGVELPSVRRGTDRVGQALRHVINQSLAANCIEREALHLMDLHELVIELTPVFHELLSDLGLRGTDCTSLRIALQEGPAGARQAMIVSEIVDHYSLSWLWSTSGNISGEDCGRDVQLPTRRMSRSQLLMEHLIHQYLFQPLPETLLAIGLRLKSILLRGRYRPIASPWGAHWFDLGYVPEAIRYKNEQLLRQQRLVRDILQSRLIRDL